uniref:RNA methyltransferase n=1 Tax=Panagrolaimus sp. PS1159 TaxID=55785 RepID=A0AC35FAH1_9BILA
MGDAPGTSVPPPHRPFKRKAGNFYNSNSKRLRCGPNSYLIVGNKHDPLNLESNEPEPSPFKEPFMVPPSPIDQTDPLSLKSPPRNAKKKKKKHEKPSFEDGMNPVFVSQRKFSVVQQKIKQSYLHQQTSQTNVLETSKPKIQEQKTVANNYKYRFGNFNRYYGNRPQLAIVDARLNFLCKDMFIEKDILDIGCNSGLLTISIAREFNPKRIIGMDIDGHLIRAAQHNIRYFCDRDSKFMHRFPMSFPHCFGPITAPEAASTTTESEATEFPHNIKFICDNYVLENDAMLEKVEEEFDIIILLSTTKWIHLNNGDDGLKRAFKRIFKQLRPNGKLILEILEFDGYRRTANTCNILKKNFENISFKPEQFADYLLSEEVGFRHFEDVGLAYAGFKGPLLIFFKDDII